jgi:hypothetical protein
MNSSQEVSKISAALAKAQGEFGLVGKSGFNTFDKYKYSDLQDYVDVTRPVLARHGLAVLSSVEEVHALDDRTTKNGGVEHVARIRMVMRIIHESGEWIETSIWGEGSDRGDKSLFKSTTGARKYGIACTFGLVTSDDPEKDSPQTAPKQQPKPQSPPPNVNKQTGEVLPLATDAQIVEVVKLIQERQLKPGQADEWFRKAGADCWDTMPSEALEKCIKYMKTRPMREAKAA